MPVEFSLRRTLPLLHPPGYCWPTDAPIVITTDLEAIVRDIDAEISRLEKVGPIPTGHTAPLKLGVPTGQRRTMSAEGRAKIAAAQEEMGEGGRDNSASKGHHALPRNTTGCDSIMRWHCAIGDMCCSLWTPISWAQQLGSCRA